MGSQTSGQKTASKYTKNAVGTLQAAQADLSQNPLYLLGQQLAQGYLQNPSTYSPELIAQMKSVANADATQAAHGAFNQFAERQGASGGYRSGATGEEAMRVAQDLGGAIQKGNTQIDAMAAQQRPIDIVNALNALYPMLQTQYGFSKDIANAYSGAATNPIWQQASPWAQVGQGVGSIGGTILGSAVPGGGSIASRALGIGSQSGK